MLQAKIDGKWGPVPEEWLPALPEEGTKAAFEFIYSYPHPASKKRTYKIQQELYPIVRVLNPKTKRPVQIGLIDGVDQNGNPIPDSIRRISLEPQARGGIHRITIGDGPSNELYQYMMLSSENESSPIRDTSVDPVFRTKDFEADAKASLALKNKRREAQGVAFALKGQDLKDMAAMLRINPNLEPGTLMDLIEQQAVANPDKFIGLYNDQDKPAKSVLANALENGSLVIDKEKRAIVYSDGGSLVLSLNGPIDDESAMVQFAEFIRNDANGKKTLQALKNYSEAKAKK